MRREGIHAARSLLFVPSQVLSGTFLEAEEVGVRRFVYYAY